MVDLAVLEKAGITEESLKRLLESEYDRTPTQLYPETQKEKLKNFRNRMRTRILQGRENNIQNYKTYYALDQAWDVPFKQISPTLLQSVMDKVLDDDKSVENMLSAWGFNPADVLVEETDAKGKKIKKINVPAFFTLFVPIMKSYVTMRLAKIMNDRRLVPFLKYEPVIDNQETRLRGHIATARGEVMSQQYGLFNVVKQAVFQMLHYSYCLLFPKEEWHTEYQESSSADEGIPDPDTKKKVRIVREGIRHHSPHPSRTFHDQAHRLCTFNTDTGCEYAGYWRVSRYKDIRENTKFYNTKNVSIGATDWWTSPGTTTFFNTMYNSCIIQAPVLQPKQNDRETEMAEQVYSSTMDDRSCLLTEYFEKVIPSECGLGNYDYPVWFRFVVAQWDTILYAAPLPYAPVIYFGYDADEERARNASMSLECLPFQDHFSQLMTQFILSTKQNLSNAVFVDEDVLGRESKDASYWLNQLRNFGEKAWRRINFIPFSGRKAQKSQHGVPQAFHSFKFNLHDTESIIRAMNIVLDTLERVLVMSSQEVAQAASHEQTREEIRNIASNTSTRVVFTAIPVDDAINALKRQVYEGWMGYGQDEFLAQIPMDHLLKKKEMEDLGFTVQEHMVSVNDKKVTVKVKKAAIPYETFTAHRDGSDRINNSEGGVAMLNFLMQLVMSPLMEVIGPKQVLSLINLSCQLIGFPREFKLDDVGGHASPEAKAEQDKQQLQQIIGQIKQSLLPDIQHGLQPIVDAVQKDQQAIGQLAQEQMILKAAMAKMAQLAGMAPQLPPTDDSLPGTTPQPGEVPGAATMAQ